MEASPSGLQKDTDVAVRLSRAMPGDFVLPTESHQARVWLVTPTKLKASGVFISIHNESLMPDRRIGGSRIPAGAESEAGGGGTQLLRTTNQVTYQLDKRFSC